MNFPVIRTLDQLFPEKEPERNWEADYRAACEEIRRLQLICDEAERLIHPALGPTPVENMDRTIEIEMRYYRVTSFDYQYIQNAKNAQRVLRRWRGT